MRNLALHFQDRKPSQKPVLCNDGKLRHPYFVTPKMLKNIPQALKAFGPFALL